MKLRVVMGDGLNLVGFGLLIGIPGGMALHWVDQRGQSRDTGHAASAGVASTGFTTSSHFPHTTTTAGRGALSIVRSYSLTIPKGAA